MLADHLRARPQHERALSPDGTHWLTVGDLVGRAASVATDVRGPVLPVATADPVEAVVRLVGAQLAGATPLVAPPGAAVLALAARATEALLALATSGTASAPRVVLRTAASWDAALGAFSDVTGQTGADVAWAPGVPTSTLTLWAIHHALSTGTPVVATGRWRGVPATPPDVTVVHGVPAVLADVLDACENGSFPRLRSAVVAGAALPAALRQRAAPFGVRVVEYYGAAELSFVAVDADGRGLRPFPGVDVRIRDGRIEARSPYLARGYAAGGGPLTIVDGWAGVGDQGRLDADGALVVAGRGDDALSVGGALVLVADVERVLGAVNGVVEVACVAEADARLGQRPAAVVRAAASADAERLVRALRDAARRELPQASRPLRYVVLDSFPRTGAGKPDRAELHRILAEQR